MRNFKEVKTRQQFDSIPFHVADQDGDDLLFFQIPPLTNFIDKIAKDELVLDLGCGTGRTTLYMLKKRPTGGWTGTELQVFGKDQR